MCLSIHQRSYYECNLRLVYKLPRVSMGFREISAALQVLLLRASRVPKLGIQVCSGINTSCNLFRRGHSSKYAEEVFAHWITTGGRHALAFTCMRCTYVCMCMCVYVM